VRQSLYKELGQSINVDLCHLTICISRYYGCLSQAILPDWFDKSRKKLHLLFRVKSSSIFMSNRWSGGADL